MRILTSLGSALFTLAFAKVTAIALLVKDYVGVTVAFVICVVAAFIGIYSLLNHRGKEVAEE